MSTFTFLKENFKKIKKIFWHFINLKTLTKYSLLLSYISIFDLWNYCLEKHLLYKSTLTPVSNLHKRGLRIITLSNYNDHSNPLSNAFEIITFEDIIFLHNAIFMHDFHFGTLPPSFSNYFTAVNQRHKYNTRLASRSSYTIPPTRTNYGKFSIKFQGAKIWNSWSKETKSLHR